MTKRFICVLITLMVLTCLPRAFAMGELIMITKANQAQKGVEFTLSAVRVSDASVLVNMEIPRKGKLKHLKRVTMDIGIYLPGVSTSPLVSADLETKLGKNDSLVVSFQVSPEMADKCSIRLGPLEPVEPMNYAHYNVELKGYITVRK